MKAEINKKYRTIRIWTSSKHAYVISFKHPRYQKWWICFSEEWWWKNPEPASVEFARVIWAK